MFSQFDPLHSVPENQPAGSSTLIPTPEEPHHEPNTGSIGSQSRIGKVFKSMLTDHHLQTSIWTAKTNYAYDTRVLFKRKITNLFISFTSLRSYVELNYTGFRKILKK